MTNVWAVTMVRDEADIVEATLRQMAANVDGLIVADNGSTDGTLDVLDRLRGDLAVPVVLVEDREPAYYQSAKMTALARAAVADYGATWVVPMDADEWWYCPHAPRIADFLERQRDKVTGVTAEIYDHVATSDDDVAVPYPARSPWRRVKALPLHKMAGRGDSAMVVMQGNHHVRFAEGERPATAVRGLVIRHFPYRCVAQFIRKVRNGAAAYAATEGLDEDAGRHWREWGAYSDEELRGIFLDWYWRDNPRARHTTSGGDVLAPLIMDPAPPSG